MTKRQSGEPNERKIGKLCEYASKNPLRIPKITDYLEQKFYKNLRNQNIGAVKAVLLVYGKLLSSCKQQMPLFASSFLGIIGSLLEQTQNHEMQILGCNALVNFISNQIDNAYLFNLEGLIPKLCQLAEEAGDDERVLRLKSAGLEVLASMVRLLGEQPHVSMDFENIISVTLENYTDFEMNQEIKKYNKQHSQGHEHAPSFSDFSKTSDLVNSKDAPLVDAHKNPSYWARACLHNMVRSATGLTNQRRVLEPVLHKFDINKLWVPEKGLAFSVLQYLLTILDETDDRSHLLLPILVKHLDNKDVSKQPVLQLQIINVTTQLSGHVKHHASVTIVGAISDLIKHLRKCLIRSSEPSSSDLQSGLENCISNLSCKLGDVGPILDIMAIALENIPTSADLARANVYAIYRTAQVISSIPNKTYFQKVFPEALFHHLLLAMSHTDHETRVIAHRVFSIVLIPSLHQTWSIQDLIPSSKAGFPTMILQDESNKSTVLETIDEETMEKDNDIIEDTSTCNGNTV
ncbi:protein SEMI-ROLLED LEAF 2-like [Bidens hawaiensis]|uniref:protein SEMI-ROLLED LEAF 2-like n=1 Tax=Bidens hawaiensis TaxID=980011 RepID=UPI00404A322C